jgi:hypothetical protein
MIANQPSIDNSWRAPTSFSVSTDLEDLTRNDGYSKPAFRAVLEYPVCKEHLSSICFLGPCYNGLITISDAGSYRKGGSMADYEERMKQEVQNLKLAAYFARQFMDEIGRETGKRRLR